MRITLPKAPPRRRNRLRLREVTIRLGGAELSVLRQIVELTGMKPQVVLGHLLKSGRGDELLQAVAAIEAAHWDLVQEVLASRPHNKAQGGQQNL